MRKLGGSDEAFVDVSSYFTKNNNISWLNANCYFQQKGKTIYFKLRGTFPSSISMPTGYPFPFVTISSSLSIKDMEMDYLIISTDWANPAVIGFSNYHSGLNQITLSGFPPVANKAFITEGNLFLN